MHRLAWISLALLVAALPACSSDGTLDNAASGAGGTSASGGSAANGQGGSGQGGASSQGGAGQGGAAQGGAGQGAGDAAEICAPDAVCTEHSESDASPVWLPMCLDQTPHCQVPTISSVFGDVTNVASASAIDCILHGITQAQPGLYRWNYHQMPSPPASSEREYTLGVIDQRLWVYEKVKADGLHGPGSPTSTWRTSVGLNPLPMVPPDCIGATDPTQQLKCLQEITLSACL